MLLLTATAAVAQALLLLGAMWEAGCELTPDTVSYNAVLKACGAAGEIATAMQARRPPCIAPSCMFQ